VCDLETSRIGAPYIYDISRLRVNIYNGCETWSFTLRGEHRLRVFESRVLRRIYGLKRDEVNMGMEKTT